MNNKIDVKKLCQQVGRKPFDDRVTFNQRDFAKCPVHSGEGEPLHLIQRDGIWLATCFSGCSKTWDAVGFVMAADRIPFLDAVTKLGGKEGAEPSFTPATPEKAKPRAMTLADWMKWGVELTPEHISRLAASRKDMTADFETFKALGCRVKGDYIGFPCSYTVTDSDGAVTGIEFDYIHLRHLDTKELVTEHAVSLHGFFNLDTVNAVEDLYVVEGEPDVAIMEQAGLRAVSVASGSQKKFNQSALDRLKVAPRIFLVGDQGTDDPGQACMDGLQKLLPLEKTFRVRFKEAKDVSELARKTGEAFPDRIAELRDDALVPWVAKNIPVITSLTADPPHWVVDRILPYGGLTILCGKQGSMKSLFAMHAAREMTFSYPDHQFLGRDIPQDVPVLYIDRENPESTISDRSRRSGMLRRSKLFYWGDWCPDETPDPDNIRLLEFAQQWKGYIIFDSLQDWYGDASEIDNTAMLKLMHRFKRLARLGSGVLILHHDAKYGDTGWRGATGIIALSDMAISAAKNKDTGNVELRTLRFRMCADWELDFRIDFNRHDQGFHAVDVVRDETVAEATAEAAYEKKLAEESRQAQVEKLNKAITDNPAATISELLDAGHGNTDSGVKSLARSAGWSYNRKTKWQRIGGTKSVNKSINGGLIRRPPVD